MSLRFEIVLANEHKFRLNNRNFRKSNQWIWYSARNIFQAIRMADKWYSQRILKQKHSPEIVDWFIWNEAQICEVCSILAI